MGSQTDPALESRSGGWLTVGSLAIATQALSANIHSRHLITSRASDYSIFRVVKHARYNAPVLAIHFDRDSRAQKWVTDTPD
eukprot:4438073-Amphidinium_carterae.1